MTVDQEFVTILAEAVKAAFARDAAPMSATRLGQVLGDAYRERGLATGPGAFKPVMDEAVRQGLIKKIWRGDRVTMALLPFGSKPPPGWVEHSPRGEPLSASPAGDLALGLPKGSPYLHTELFEAFSGKRSPAWLDLSDPPHVRVCDAGESSFPRVTALQTELIVEAWERFAREHNLAPPVASKFAAELGRDPWSKIDFGEQGPRLGSTFHRKRLWLLIDHVRAWFGAQQKDPGMFHLAQTSRAKTATAATAPASTAAHKERNAQVLRERLKLIIDQMTLEQLYELRIPVEYLEP